MEQEIYIDKISKDYNISKEAIYSEVKKMLYQNTSSNSKLLTKTNSIRNNIPKKVDTKVSEGIRKRENTIISLLLTADLNVYPKIKNEITPENFKVEENKIILKRLYEEYSKGATNIYDAISLFSDENIINHLSEIMSEDYEISDVNKCIEDIINSYKKETIIEYRDSILKELDNQSITDEERQNLEKELNNVIIKLAQMK